MSKLIIPAAKLIGTPLTQEELKGIIAGRAQSSCSCHLADSHGNVVTPSEPYIYGLANKAACETECNKVCNNLNACDHVTEVVFSPAR